ncbi:30S ribosomal protein S3 [Candidatus Woesearchaeota archaeon]|nr:30S ribosomal protein S3 [Candidatus Woesearchaeota archaeon]
MIERQILSKKMKENLIEGYIAEQISSKAYSRIEIKKTPLGERILVYTSKPGLVVGRGGSNISKLTHGLKTRFDLENPQIEVIEIENPNLDPKTIADKIVANFERYGPKRFKSVGYRSLQDIMDAGATGAEIVISGRGVPGSRAKSWRFSAGHLKKSGDISENYMIRAISVAHLKSGSVGIKVSILTPDVELPDNIRMKELPAEDKKINLEKTKKEDKENKEDAEEKES